MALLDTITSLQGSDGGVIAPSKGNELLTKIHNILDNAVSKWVGNTTGGLACVCPSSFRQHHEVLAP